VRLITVLCAVVLWGCGPTAPDEVINGLVVVTQPSPSTDFAALRTFTMATQVNLVAQTPPGTKSWMADIPNLLSAVEANLVARG